MPQFVLPLADNPSVKKVAGNEFEAISERGGVFGAMDTMYQRGKIHVVKTHSLGQISHALNEVDGEYRRNM